MQKYNNPISTVRKVTDGAATATTQSSKFNAGGYTSAKAYLNITAVSGTTPTMVVKFQDSADGTNWVDVASGAFSSQNATGLNSLVISNVGPYLRAVYTIGGTTPSFTFSLQVAGVA